MSQAICHVSNFVVCMHKLVGDGVASEEVRHGGRLRLFFFSVRGRGKRRRRLSRRRGSAFY